MEEPLRRDPYCGSCTRQRVGPCSGVSSLFGEVRVSRSKMVSQCAEESVCLRDCFGGFRFGDEGPEGR
jgi:hypothetical protein